MYYLVKDTMGSKLVVVDQYSNLEDCQKRKDLEESSKYSFETYWVCTVEEYKDLLRKYV